MTTKKTEGVCKFGLMEADMTAFGEITWQMAKEDSYMQKETSTKESGLMIKPMDMVFILTLMGVNIKDNGFKINSMGTA
jgi:hypothetical protein